MGPELLLNILMFFPGYLMAIVVHEFAHSWVANRFGDPTARMLGRMTLDPRKHIDPWGTIILPFVLLLASHGSFMFGYAKPVPITVENLKNPKRDSIWISLAGPAANLLTAALLILLAWPLRYAGWLQNPGTVGVMYTAVTINLIIAAFNLLPLPPLDGSKILLGILPDRWGYQYERITPYSFLIFLALFYFQVINMFMIPVMMTFKWLLSFLGNPFGM